MLNLAPEKMLFVAFIAMVILGPEKLPEMARKFGKIMAELRRVSDGFQQELRQAIDDTGAGDALNEVLHGESIRVGAPSEAATLAVVETTAQVVDTSSGGDEPAQIVARGPSVETEPALGEES